MRRRGNLAFVILILFGAVVFAFSSALLQKEKRIDPSPEIAVALPLFVQVLMTGGDRFFAANLGSFRALIIESAKMQPDEYKILAKLQIDVSWLNPAHEDNFYTASGILSWNNQLDAAQTILRRATLSRPYDYQPPFYYAFNLVYFMNDPVKASEWLRMAALKLPNDNERVMLENFAARWLDRSNDLGLAIAVVESMAQQAKRKDFREYLQMRVQRLRGLLSLRQAADAFLKKEGHSVQSLEQLVEAGFIQAIPADPFGVGFKLDSSGIPAFGGVKVDEYGNKY